MSRRTSADIDTDRWLRRYADLADAEDEVAAREAALDAAAVAARAQADRYAFLDDDERGDLVGHATPTVGRVSAYLRAERAGEA